MSIQPGGTGTEPNVVVIKERGGWFGKALVFVGVAGVLFATYLGLAAVSLLPDFFKNPFEKEVTEHSGPVLLESITDSSEHLAAKGSFQVVVDYEESRKYIPNLAFSCQVVFVGYGDVDAYVDVSGLSEDAIQISADGTEVTVTLPEPQLSDVDSNITESYVLVQDQGIWQRIVGFITGRSDCPGELQLLQISEGKIAEAALESDLIDRARENTRIWLEGLLRSLGYDRVTINFEPNPQ